MVELGIPLNPYLCVVNSPKTSFFCSRFRIMEDQQIRQKLQREAIKRIRMEVLRSLQHKPPKYEEPPSYQEAYIKMSNSNKRNLG